MRSEQRLAAWHTRAAGVTHGGRVVTYAGDRRHVRHAANGRRGLHFILLDFHLPLSRTRGANPPSVADLAMAEFRQVGDRPIGDHGGDAASAVPWLRDAEGAPAK